MESISDILKNLKPQTEEKKESKQPELFNMDEIKDNPKRMFGDKHKYISTEYQVYGLRLAGKLGDTKRTTMYIKWAKEKPRAILEMAYSFTIDYPNTPVIWESFAGQKADRTLEITDKNLHDTWNKYLEVYPQDPSRPVGSTFRIEIYENGDIQIIPDKPASKED